MHGCEIPIGAVTHDFYRQALELDLRNKRGYTAEILSALGGIDKRQFSRYKNLLHLGDEAIELADRHNIQESLLRYVIELQPIDQVEVIRQIIQLGLTRNQIKDLIEKGGQNDQSDDETELPSRQVMQFAKLMKTNNLPDAYSLAKALVDQEKDVNVARARLQTMKGLLDDVEKYLVQ